MLLTFRTCVISFHHALKATTTKQKEKAMTATLELTAREVFAAEFNALLNNIEVTVVPAVNYPKRDFSGFTL